MVYKPTNITGGPILYGVPVFPWRYEVVATYWASGPILWNAWKQCTRRSTTCGASNGGAGTWEGQGHGIFGVEMLENAGKKTKNGGFHGRIMEPNGKLLDRVRFFIAQEIWSEPIEIERLVQRLHILETCIHTVLS